MKITKFTLTLTSLFASATLLASSENILWHYKDNVNLAQLSVPSIAKDGSIYTARYYTAVSYPDPIILALNPDGTKKWSVSQQVGGEHARYFNTLIGPDGTVYAYSGPDGRSHQTSSQLIAIQPDGKIKWLKSVNVTYTKTTWVKSVQLGPDNRIYITLDDWGKKTATLIAVNLNGELEWQVHLPERVVANPIVAENTKIYLGTMTGKLYVVSSKGQFVWVQQLAIAKSHHTGMPINKAVLGKDGVMYFMTDDVIYAVLNDGTVKWTSKRFDENLQGITIATQDGVVYVSSMNADGQAQGTIYALNNQGQVMWQYHDYVGLPANVILSPDNTIYAVNTHHGTYGNLYPNLIALDKEGHKLCERAYNLVNPDGFSFGDKGIIYAAGEFETGGGISAILPCSVSNQS